jgi:hypothetical protein
MVPKQLICGTDGKRRCPECGNLLEFVEGEPVKIVQGKVNMDDTESHYVCSDCKLIFRPLVHTEYYNAYPLPKKVYKKVKKAMAVGDLQPMRLQRDASGHCECPRCGANMLFVEGEPVRIVDGKLNMHDVLDHFICDACSSVYRRIATTDYFQWHAE